MRAIDWNYWTNLAYVSVWDSCALSLAIDPHSFDDQKRYYEFGPGANQNGSGVNRIIQIRTMTEFTKRRQLLSMELSHGQRFAGTSVDKRLVRLPAFVQWIRELDREPPLPKELLRLILHGQTSPPETRRGSEAALTRRATSVSDQHNRVVLDAIAKIGFHPMDLPKPRPGMAGAKSQVWKSFDPEPFSRTVFEKTWLRLRAQGKLSSK